MDQYLQVPKYFSGTLCILKLIEVAHFARFGHLKEPEDFIKNTKRT